MSWDVGCHGTWDVMGRGMSWDVGCHGTWGAL